MAEKWWEAREVAGDFWLGTTRFFVAHTPAFVVKIIAFFVAGAYFLLLPKRRENILTFRARAGAKGGAFDNFYAFALAIADKFAVWIKEDALKIDYSNLNNISPVFETLGRGRGKVLITSHYGNIEIAKALASKLKNVKVNILLYQKGSEKFNQTMARLGEGKIEIFAVESLEMDDMMRLAKKIERGEHVAVMGDRVPIAGDKIASVEFLGERANFGVGAYLIAGVLEAEIYSFWCYKELGEYKFEISKLPALARSRDKIAAAMPPLRAYVSELERKCLRDPSQWFNFFDFWGQNDK